MFHVDISWNNDLKTSGKSIVSSNLAEWLLILNEVKSLIKTY